MPIPEANDQPAKCFNCGDACSEDDLCHGCHKYVCTDCAINYDMPMGPHDEGLHLEEPDDA